MRLLAPALMVVIIVAAAGLAILLPRQGPSQGLGNASSPGSGGVSSTTGSPGTGTTSGGGPGPGEAPNASSNVWERYDVIEGLVVSPYYDPNFGKLVEWPAEIDGRPLAVNEFEAVYNISLATGRSIVLHVSWGLEENRSFTAGCVRNGQERYESFDNVYAVTYNMSWDGGYIAFKAYAYNASALFWFHIIPIFQAPVTGYWQLGILGAELASPTGILQWSNLAAAAPMDPDMADCEPIKTGQGDPLEMLQDSSIYWLISSAHSYPVFEFLPWEVFPGALAELQDVTGTYDSGWTPGGTGYYDEYKYTVSFLGTRQIPGMNMSVPVWRLRFTTDPMMVRGEYVISTFTVIPFSYNITLSTLDNETITIQYNLSMVTFMDWHTGQPLT